MASEITDNPIICPSASLFKLTPMICITGYLQKNPPVTKGQPVMQKGRAYQGAVKTTSL